MSGNPFRVALTADFYDPTGQPRFDDLGLSIFDRHPHVDVTKFPTHQPEILPEQLNGFQGSIVLTPRVSAATLANSENFLAIGRFGVGYDSVDVAACTRNHVLAMITAGAVDRPVAEATITWMLALTHQLMAKDRLVRTGEWDARTKYMGCELRDRTLGVIGLGGIGQCLVRLLESFGMKPPIAFDPMLPASAFEAIGVRSVSLEELMRTSDFVSIHCPLNDKTRGLIGPNELSWMKPDSYLLNTARGGIVDENALYGVLKNRRIAGAALDCFAVEPVVTPSRFGDLDNVLLAPHSIAWTHEMFRDIGRTACQSMLDLSLGKWPHGVLNPELKTNPEFLAKWKRITGVEPLCN